MPPKFRKDFHDLLEKMSVQGLVHIFKDKLSFHSVSVYCCFIGYSVIGLKYSLVLASIAAVTVLYHI